MTNSVGFGQVWNEYSIILDHCQRWQAHEFSIKHFLRIFNFCFDWNFFFFRDFVRICGESCVCSLIVLGLTNLDLIETKIFHVKYHEKYIFRLEAHELSTKIEIWNFIRTFALLEIFLEILLELLSWLNRSSLSV